MIKYVYSMMDKGQCDKEKWHHKAPPKNKDAVLTALDIVLNPL